MITERLLPRLGEFNPKGIETFADPDMQYALRAALETYARTGEHDVADLLVDILVNRTAEPERNLRQLALTESLAVASKLVTEQYAVLSLIWLIRYTSDPAVTDLESLVSSVKTNLGPYLELARPSRSIYEHLEYTGCGTISLGETDLPMIFRTNYPGVFASGFDDADMAQAFDNQNPDALQELLIPWRHTGGLWQFNAASGEQLEEQASAVGFTSRQIEQAVGLLKAKLLSESAIREILIEASPSVAGPLFDLWENSQIKSMNLTTVGIAIAHANCRRVMGRTPGPLSTWID